MITDPLTALADQHVSAGARRGALLQYAALCRRDAEDASAAGEHGDARELVAEAQAAELRALELAINAGVA